MSSVPLIAVSTAWNAERHVGWAPAARELLEMGFPALALDGPAVQADAADAGAVTRAKRGEIVALFAPLPRRDASSPMDVGGLVSQVPGARTQALAAALAAGRAASAAGTGRVVLRVGEIPVVDGAREQRWNDRLAAEGASAALRDEVRAAFDELRSDRPRYVESLCRSVWELCRAAPEMTWLVGTPGTVAGLPFPPEAEVLLSELRNRRTGLWHDTAHGARLGALGVVPPDDWLAQGGSRTQGVTISDWSPGGGRTPPGAGLVDWSALRPQLGTSMTRVLRLDAAYPASLLLDAAREAASLAR